MGLPNQGNTCSRDGPVSLHEKHPRFYFVFAIIVFIIGVTFLVCLQPYSIIEFLCILHVSQSNIFRTEAGEMICQCLQVDAPIQFTGVENFVGSFL